MNSLDRKTLRKTLALTDDFSRVAVILKGREFDRFAQDLLTRHLDAVFVHIGCGLDTRFERVCSEQADNGRVEWYDLDLPEVIELRRRSSAAKGSGTISWLAQCFTRGKALGCHVMPNTKEVRL